MFTEEQRSAAEAVLTACRSNGLRLATAESCTGGLLSALLTDIPGSSDVFGFGFVTYANEAKTRLLGVDKDIITEYGAVSEPVASAMALGALRSAAADIAISITGIAGPGGGSEQKPVGLVYIALASGDDLLVEECRFSGNRQEIREQAVIKALRMLTEALKREFSYVA